MEANEVTTNIDTGEIVVGQIHKMDVIVTVPKLGDGLNEFKVTFYEAVVRVSSVTDCTIHLHFDVDDKQFHYRKPEPDEMGFNCVYNAINMINCEGGKMNDPLFVCNRLSKVLTEPEPKAQISQALEDALKLDASLSNFLNISVKKPFCVELKIPVINEVLRLNKSALTCK
jgi:hypothetical protein